MGMEKSEEIFNVGSAVIAEMVGMDSKTRERFIEEELTDIKYVQVLLDMSIHVLRGTLMELEKTGFDFNNAS